MPDLTGRSSSTALTDTADTRLGRAVAPLAQLHPEQSGVFPLAVGSDAFAARALLANAAERSIDAQYYIWHRDMSGTLLFEALRRAADRGVRVRLLLDDNNTTGMDSSLSALDAHPNIEVRLFNPFMHRKWRALGYLTDFPRLNRRMHNKSFTVDNQATIIGGRNVGDEYFDAGGNALFIDVDVMAIGPVVNDVSRDFDRYWASESAYPADRVLPAVDRQVVAALAEEASVIERDPAAAAYTQALGSSPFIQELLGGQLPLEWSTVRMISDDPAKGLGGAPDSALLPQQLANALGTPTRELELVSPYFVPTQAGVDVLVGLVERGVSVAVLTNSLEATDVAAVHAGYAKRRRSLLEAGVALYELKRSFSVPSVQDRGLPGSSGSSLHAKTFSVDRSRLFIGSFNLDPRSAQLNTENGFVIDSPVLAQRMADAIAGGFPAYAYVLRLDGAGSLQWVEQQVGVERVHDREPGAGFWRRVTVFVLSMLPIEWLL